VRTPAGVRVAYKAIYQSVKAKVNAAAFQGVTVQPMIQLKDSYELILGASPDPQFGPALLFGSGGQLVEIFKDRALALPPLNTTLARRLMERTLIYKALQGTRGRKSVDLKALEQLLVRFSQLVLGHPDIREIDINPLLASPEGLVAVDARVVLYDPKIKNADRPQPAIRPYPTVYVGGTKLRDGTAVVIRPIRHQDEPLMVQFHKTLSERSVYLRYFQELKLDDRVKHERLLRRCFIDYEREMALIAEGKTKRSNPAEILGVARYTKKHGSSEAEFALLVSDKKQRQGLGQELLKRLIHIAREEKVERLTADMLRDNHGMQALCKTLGFTIEGGLQEPVVTARLDLR